MKPATDFAAGSPGQTAPEGVGINRGVSRDTTEHRLRQGACLDLLTKGRVLTGLLRRLGQGILFKHPRLQCFPLMGPDQLKLLPDPGHPGGPLRLLRIQLTGRLELLDRSVLPLLQPRPDVSLHQVRGLAVGHPLKTAPIHRGLPGIVRRVRLLAHGWSPQRGRSTGPPTRSRLLAVGHAGRRRRTSGRACPAGSSDGRG